MGARHSPRPLLFEGHDDINSGQASPASEIACPPCKKTNHIAMIVLRREPGELTEMVGAERGVRATGVCIALLSKPGARLRKAC